MPLPMCFLAILKKRERVEEDFAVDKETLDIR